ncbi:MAG TPA: hypothetical protein VMQ67_03400 [Candidatus Saccharimonadales bacterium]|nr:hypothetical protein [Candidatus Saccharimonadales bacterium]
MKKSALVTLVLSGALVSGCDDRSQYGDPGYGAGANVTNNTYVSGLGYYHAPYHGWFEYPYNYYRPGFGYYHGGIYTPRPLVSGILSSPPSIPSTFGGSRGGGGAHFGSTESSSSVTRGGFGSIGHGGFTGS